MQLSFQVKGKLWLFDSRLSLGSSESETVSPSVMLYPLQPHGL